MKRGIILSAFIAAMVLVTGFSSYQSDGKETRNVDDFTSVSFGIAGNLYINLGSDFEVILEGKESYLDNIITRVSGDRLVIRKDSWRFNMNERVNVYITMPEIDGLGVSGSGRAKIMDAVRSDNLDLNVSGSGKLYTSDLEIDEMDCSISGSGDIIIEGRGNIDRGDISISGSGNYNGEEVKIEMADIHISGSGGCRCHVTESLKASVSGSGGVVYYGNPKVDARVSGSGRVKSR